MSPFRPDLIECSIFRLSAPAQVELLLGNHERLAPGGARRHVVRRNGRGDREQHGQNGQPANSRFGPKHKPLLPRAAAQRHEFAAALRSRAFSV